MNKKQQMIDHVKRALNDARRDTHNATKHETTKQHDVIDMIINDAIDELITCVNLTL